jgi:predicted ATPase/DNA-binding CsgD family transcriptional regulator
VSGADGRRSAGNLADELSEFVGRRNEVAASKAALTQSRMVTLTGTGGIGKTRLAVRVAGEVRRAFTDGVWLVELANLRDAVLIAREVARALGFSDRSTSWAVTTLCQHLAHRRALLVLDNCEHVLDPCAVLVETILRRCSGVRVLATSREPLGVSGEVVVPVPTMSVPETDQPLTAERLLGSEAARLFLSRAADVRPGFAATTQNAQAIGELVERLEGIPLAIELAAVRVRSLSARQILARLEDRFELLSGGRRTAQARHKTLAATMSWSYDLLTADEQTIWRRTTVFSGSFDLDSAEAVCDGDGIERHAVFALVDALVGKSVLLREPGETVARYRMLDTLREFGRGQLQRSHREHWLAGRHRDWFAHLAATFEPFGPDQLEWIDRLHGDHANLRAALEFCLLQPGEAVAGLRMICDLWPYWETRGHLTEGRRWIRVLLDAVGDDCALQARGLWVAGYLDMVQGDIPAALSHLERAVDLGQSQDEPTVAYAFQFLGRSVWLLGDLDRGLTLTEHALRLHRSAEDWIGVVLTLVQLGVIRLFSGQPAGIDPLFEECIQTCADHGERWNRSYALWAFGLSAWLAGRLDEAANLVTEGLRLKRDVRDPIGIPLCMEALAWIAGSQNDAQRAAVLLGAAAESWQELSGSLPKPLLNHHARCRASARQALGADAFDAAYAQGRRRTPDHAVQTALREAPQPANETAATRAKAGELTQRERQIVALIGEGLSNAEIARSLMISTRTAESHVRHIMDKLGLSRRTQIAGWAVSGGLPGFPPDAT